MKGTVLYRTPYPPMRSGIADYASAYKAALEGHTDWRFDVTDLGERVPGNSPRDLVATFRRVERWRRDARLANVALVHAEIGFRQHDEFWTLFWLRRLLPEVPYCVTVHDPPLVLAPALHPLAFGIRGGGVRRALRTLDYTPLGRSVVRSVLGRAGGVCVLSEAGARALRGVLDDPRRVRTLPFLAYGWRRTERPGASTDAPLKVLLLGFWGPGKGIEVLLEAVERVLVRSPATLRLVLAGGLEEGGANRRYVESVRQRIRRSPGRDAIDEIGYVPAETLDGVFAAADVFVQPAVRMAGLSASSVLFRAMAAGLAVVASDLGTFPEEVRHLETGLLVPPGDAGALASTLLRLAADGALRERLGRQARAHVETEHDGARVAQAAATVYGSVARP